MEYIIGNSIGIIQILLGYPFDTIKVNLQNDNKIKINYKFLFNGAKYPLIQSCMGNSLLFGNYKLLKDKGYNDFISGGISGFFTGFIINPFEVLKVNKQTNININKINYFRGLNHTLLRESFASGIYFTTFNYLNNNLKINTFLAGGIAGINSWIFTYPIDTIKTRIQTNQNINNMKIVDYFKGVKFALLRAFIVNSIGLYIFDYAEKEYLDK